MAESEDSTKRCTACREIKPLTGFYRRNDAKCGYFSHCIGCRRGRAQRDAVRNREYHKRRYVENRASILAARAARYAAHPEKSIARTGKWQRANVARANATKARWLARNAEKRKASVANYYRANRETIAKKNAAWQKANAAKVVAKSARYYKNHPEKKREVDAAFHASRRGAPGAGVSVKQWQEIKADALGICAYCNEHKRLGMDHIEPIVRGGAHDVDNIAAACRSCNSSKNDTPLLLWLAKKALVRAA